jgi:hypothetical protein
MIQDGEGRCFGDRKGLFIVVASLKPKEKL